MRLSNTLIRRPMTAAGIARAGLTLLLIANFLPASEPEARPLPEAKPESNPEDVIDHLQSGLIETMKVGHEILFPGRYERLEPIILETHKIPYLARLTIGRHWRKIGDEEREQFLDSFSKFIISTYASRFKKFKGERFEPVKERELRKGRILLVTDLYKGNGDTLRFNYVLSRFDDKWQIINVIVKGISDVALKRAEFTSIIERDGFPALLSHIEEKVAEIRKTHEEEGT